MADVNIEENVQNEELIYTSAPFLKISVKKLAIMMFFSVGIYGLYWFYANWARQRRFTGESLSQFWRTFFMLFFMPSMLGRVKTQLVAHEIENKYNSVFWFAVYLTSAVLGIGINRFSETGNSFELALFLVLFLTTVSMDTLVLCYAQIEMNKINEKYPVQIDNQYRIGDWVWFVLGTLYWLFMIMTLLILPNLII